MDKQNYAVAGIGLVLGAALGTVLFALLGQVWAVGAGAGAGLIVGAFIDAAWVSQRATKHATATKPDPGDRPIRKILPWLITAIVALAGYSE